MFMEKVLKDANIANKDNREDDKLRKDDSRRLIAGCIIAVAAVSFFFTLCFYQMKVFGM